METTVKHRVVILIAWFGKWPFWMDFFIESCKWNPNIHWKIVTDCDNPANMADNVELIKTTFKLFSERASEQLNICFNPENPYKLCDIKPLLGYLFEEKIKDYDFWGFGDLDVIYGNLTKFFTDSLLGRYDLISTHATRVSGHFCLLRNNQLMRNIFRRVPEWKKVLECSEHLAFDEKHFSKLFVKHKNFPRALQIFLDQFSSLRRRSLFRETYSTPHLRFNWIDGSRNFPKTWKWKQGSLVNDRDGKRQFPYLHFMYWKGDVWSDVTDKASLINVPEKDISKGWHISEKGFTSLQD